jgi:Integrase core domain
VGGLGCIPHLNGKVERSHRFDEQEFYQLLDKGGIADDIHLFNDKLREWEDYYNYHRPHGALDGQNPLRAAHGKIHCQSVDEVLRPHNEIDWWSGAESNHRHADFQSESAHVIAQTNLRRRAGAHVVLRCVAMASGIAVILPAPEQTRVALEQPNRCFDYCSALRVTRGAVML